MKAAGLLAVVAAITTPLFGFGEEPGAATGVPGTEASLACTRETVAGAADHQEPAREESAWGFARDCFDRAEFATNNAQRAGLAEQGIASCREILQRDPESAGAHYYLGMNLGQLARTKTLGALKLVDEMEELFQRARELDEGFDNAGPDRNLGLLYLKAPGWPASIGNRSNARRHLYRCVELAPQFPGNRLCLLEALVKWDEFTGAAAELKSMEKMLPEARRLFSQPRWKPSWEDWERRLQQVQGELQESPRVLRSPRGGS